MLELDTRQRAMLEEMGVKLWWPAPERAADVAAVAIKKIADGAGGTGATARFGPQNEPAAPAPVAARVAAPVAPRAPAPALPGTGIWLEARAHRLYGAADAPPQGGWLIAVDMPPGPDGQHGEPLAGDAGRLLDNMLRALRLDAGAAPVHLVRVHRGAPGPADASQPLAEGVAAQIDALAPRLVLALGPLAAQCLFGSTEPLGKLRGRVGVPAQRDGLPLVASYPPAYLLRNPLDKAKAWADLCLAAHAFEQQQPG